MSKWIVDIHGDIEGDYELICKAESTIPLAKIKETREEMQNYKHGNGNMFTCGLNKAVEILDKLIESEG